MTRKNQATGTTGTKNGPRTIFDVIEEEADLRTARDGEGGATLLDRATKKIKDGTQSDFDGHLIFGLRACHAVANRPKGQSIKVVVEQLATEWTTSHGTGHSVRQVNRVRRLATAVMDRDHQGHGPLPEAIRNLSWRSLDRAIGNHRAGRDVLAKPSKPKRTPDDKSRNLEVRWKRLLTDSTTLSEDLRAALLVQFATDAVAKMSISGSLSDIEPVRAAVAAILRARSKVAGGVTGLPFDEQYRPQRFSEVIGQEAAVQQLRNDARQKAIVRYLISGPTGTGKSTLARIYSRAWLCESPVDGDPCDLCDACLTSRKRDTGPLFGRIIELSAAHDADKVADRVREWAGFNTGNPLIVNEADRLLIEHKSLLAMLEREVSAPLFFCSAEAGKFSPEFLGRVPMIETVRVTASEMGDHLQRIAKQEGRTLPQEDLDSIVSTSNGQVRDALKKLEIWLRGEPVRDTDRADNTSLAKPDTDSSPES